MSEKDKKKIADEADMIIRGYAYTKKDGNVVILNLNDADPHCMIISTNGIMLESSMDPIEQEIAIEVWNDNKEFMEA